jgi:hypothetical protein
MGSTTHITACLHGCKRIEAFFPANGGFRTMSCIDNHLIPQGIELVSDAGDEGIKIPAGKIGPADGTGKKRIPDKNHPVRMQRDAARRMSWRVKDRKRYFPEFKAIAVLNRLVRGRRILDREPKCGGSFRKDFQHGLIECVYHKLCAGGFLQLPVCADMIEMAVRIDDILNRQLLLRQLHQDPARFGAGVDDRGFSCLFTAQYKTICHNWPNGQGLKNQIRLLING